MANKLIYILLVFLFPFAMFGQNKSASVKSKVVSKTAVVKSANKYSPERELRLAQRIQVYNSLVVLKNNGHILPLNRLDTLKIQVVSIGTGHGNQLHQMMDRYSKTAYLELNSSSEIESFIQTYPTTTGYNLVILVIGDKLPVRENMDNNDTYKAGKNESSITAVEEKLLNKVPKGTKVVLLYLGSPHFAENNTFLERADALVAAGRSDYDFIDLSAQLIFGAIGAAGKLPEDLGKYKKGDGIAFLPSGRLRYVIPEEVGIDSVKLAQKMDSLVELGLKVRAFPGCQMLLAKKGQVFYQKSYGFLTFDQSRPVQNDDLYDLASVTKILAPLPALMMLADQNKFQVDKKMSDYWTNWKGSNKEGILVSDLLSHQARLKPGIVLWPVVIDGMGHYISEYCSLKQKPGYNLRASNGLYLLDSFPNEVYSMIRDSPLLKTKKYVYSDLGFAILPGVIEKLTGENYEKYLQERLYAKLGASTLMYNPWSHEEMDKIAPTENDKTFRHEQLQGFVHDETAAMMGGISGNAGLFGTAGDVAKVMQLYLQGGEYGNERFISVETIKNWTSSHRGKTINRRGYGFDKPGIQNSRYKGKVRYPSTVVSEESYGHSGFTGTFTWADPANDMLFVFLSNRVYPDRNNHKINKLNLRQQILENAFKLVGNQPVAEH